MERGLSSPRDPLVLTRIRTQGAKNAAFFLSERQRFNEYAVDRQDGCLSGVNKNFNGKADNGSELFGHDPAGGPRPRFRRPGERTIPTGTERRCRRDRRPEGPGRAREDGEPGRCGDQVSRTPRRPNAGTPPTLSQDDQAKLTGGAGSGP